MKAGKYTYKYLYMYVLANNGCKKRSFNAYCIIHVYKHSAADNVCFGYQLNMFTDSDKDFLSLKFIASAAVHTSQTIHICLL